MALLNSWVDRLNKQRLVELEAKTKTTGGRLLRAKVENGERRKKENDEKTNRPCVCGVAFLL
jgi:hypothetical protein